MVNYAHRLKIQDSISTDCILPDSLKSDKKVDEKELAKHLFEGIEENFSKRIKQGDFIVAGASFGCGPAREQAALALKASGLGAVIAKSYGRIFYRNAFNFGLCLIECETNYIDDMDQLELDLERNLLMNVSKGVQIEIKPIPKIMKKFLAKGGIVRYFKEHRGLAEPA